MVFDSRAERIGELIPWSSINEETYEDSFAGIGRSGG